MQNMIPKDTLIDSTNFLFIFIHFFMLLEWLYLFYGSRCGRKRGGKKKNLTNLNFQVRCGEQFEFSPWFICKNETAPQSSKLDRKLSERF